MTPLELRERRQELGLSLSELAAELDYTKRALVHYEAGTRAIPRVVELALSSLRRPRRRAANTRNGDRTQ
jgi:transcriptional regulator with XRE-family HTH domain